MSPFIPTSDLCDAHPEAQVFAPLFQDFGGQGRFSGPAFTLRVYENNTLVRATLGIEPEVITGLAEASLSFTGAVAGLPGAESTLSGPLLVADIGGGSTELVLGSASQGAVLAAHSMDVGCVRMTERHLHSDPPLPAEIEATLRDLQFAWRAVRATKSNAILLASGGASVGIGMGQVNRVDSCKLAVERAGEERARGSVAASDAFFPFADGPKILVDAGVRAIVAPGGSIRDDETIELARSAGVTLYFTGTRHFAH